MTVREEGITRRAMLAGGAGAVAAAVGMLSVGKVALAQEASEMTWDEEADVVVIGSGNGLYTALRTQKEGLSTIVLEKAGFVGGSTFYSSSVVWAPSNSLMTEAGYSDSRDEALEYIEAGAGDTYLPDHAATYVDNINTAIENITTLTGLEWMIWSAGIDYCVYLPGGKELGRALCPKVDSGSTATLLINAIKPAAEEAGVNVMLETPAVDLITRTKEDGCKEVIGVLAEREGQQVNVKANVAVVMACGGFDWNDDMMANYQRSKAHYSWGVPAGTGDGQKMAMRIGADMRFMNEAWMSPGYKVEHEAAKESAQAKFASLIRDDSRRGLIFVNAQGKRFTNECANYDSIGRSFTAVENNGERRGWANLPAWAICDQTCVDTYGLNMGDAGAPGESWTQYESLEELAEACGIDAEGLANQVASFNENAAQGLDPEFGRGQDYYAQNSVYTDANYEGAARTLAPLETAPFWAAEIVPVVLGTMGGVKIDANAQALDVDGNVIGRLYAQGNCAGVGCGGVFYTGGGGTNGPALAFGEKAASEIVKLEAWV